MELIRPNMTTQSTQQKSTRDNTKDVMYGFEDELLAVQERLCGESCRREIIPIIGMGGSGKTTLARHIYGSKLAKDNFDIRSWVTISQEYQVQNILQKLISNSERTDDIGLLTENLYKRLKGRRYLIILDDMWDGEAWDSIRRSFPDDGNGSRIILTTRVSGVAAYVDCAAPVHQMRLLNNDESWDLLRKKVFGEETYACPLELEEIGKLISKKCKGLPLAIAVIAGTLSIEKSLDHWLYVAENLMSTLDENRGGDIFEILSLSYINLPHYLRPCFLYLGCFREDQHIDISMLIRLWIAEGFIDESSGSPEEIAEKYLEELVNRNLVLVVSRSNADKEIEKCSIHDVLREWCVRRAAEECVFIHLNEHNANIKETTLNQRRVVINGCSLEGIDGSQIRTILFLDGDEKSLDCLGRFTLLRVLDASKVVHDSEKHLFSQIVDLFHLRFLSLTARRYFELPGTISKLSNLQTLILNPFQGVLLPTEIWNLQQLRHLEFAGTSLIFPARPSNGKMNLLSNLQTLSTVSNFRCVAEMPNMMPNLNKLGLCCWGDSDMLDALKQLKNLPGLTKLKSLELNMHVNNEANNFYWLPSLVYENLVFPVTLTRLCIWYIKLPWECMGIIGSLPNLEVLELKQDSFVGEEWETSDGGFCRLRQLIIDYLNLCHWTVAESNHFPSLRVLRIYNCFKLEGIPDTIGEISTLERIELSTCCESVYASAEKIEEEQESYGNNLFRVHILYR